MADFSSDQTRMLGIAKTVQVLRSTDGDSSGSQSLGQDKTWRPNYIFMDCIQSMQSTDPPYRDLLVNSEPNKQVSLFFKGSVLLLALLLTFVLGFIFGVMFPFYLASQRITLLTNSNETSNFDENNLNQANTYSIKNSVKVEPNNFQRVIVDGIYWSDFVEGFLPDGFGSEDDSQWVDLVHKSVVVRIEEGCGRMQNRLVTFRDGKKACCRYRQNTDQIQGEIFSYHLGRALFLENLVPSALMAINSSAPLWQSVKPQLESSQWLDGHPVVLTKFVEDLVPARIPPALRNFTSDILDIEDFEASNKKNTLFETVFKIQDTDTVMNIADKMKTEEDLIEMAQWSDLIIFDYLTANLDRIVNNLYNLQWNPGMLSSPAHNLARVSTSDLLVFLDNESGLLHGYRLLEKYEPFHSLLLDALCVFRRPTIQALRSLRTRSALSSLLRPDALQDLLPALPDRNINVLSQRVEHVLKQVDFCAQKRHIID